MRQDGDDPDLVQAAWRGDAAAFGALLERHRAPLHAVALSILRDREEAQDAVQEAFLVALRRLDDLRSAAAAGAWLRAIVRNSCLMRLRSVREVPRDVSSLDRTPATDAGPEGTLDRLALGDWVWSSLEKLPTDLRAAVMLRYFTHRSSYAEIADVLGIPIGTVRSRLNQAKGRLGDVLLSCAGQAHRDYTKLAEERWRSWSSAITEMNITGVPSLYFSDLAPEVLVDKQGVRAVGVKQEWRNISEGLASGVRLSLTGLVVSSDITIIEADHDNPADDPDHCPPSLTEIRVHPQGQTTRWIVHLAPVGLATGKAPPRGQEPVL